MIVIIIHNLTNVNFCLQIKQDYAVIKKEALELGQLQREMALAFQQQLQETVQKLQALTDKEAAAHVSKKFIFFVLSFNSPLCIIVGMTK